MKEQFSNQSYFLPDGVLDIFFLFLNKRPYK